jgi:hypothetical protein
MRMVLHASTWHARSSRMMLLDSLTKELLNLLLTRMATLRTRWIIFFVCILCHRTCIPVSGTSITKMPHAILNPSWTSLKVCLWILHLLASTWQLSCQIPTFWWKQEVYGRWDDWIDLQQVARMLETVGKHEKVVLQPFHIIRITFIH